MVAETDGAIYYSSVPGPEVGVGDKDDKPLGSQGAYS